MESSRRSIFLFTHRIIRKPLRMVGSRPTTGFSFRCSKERTPPRCLGTALTISNSDMRSGDRLLDPRLELALGRRTDLGRGNLAAVEEHESRYAAYAILRWGPRIVVNVDLDHLDLGPKLL